MPPKSLNLVYKAKEEAEFSKIFESWDMSSDELSLDSFYATILTSKNFPNGILDLKMLVHKALILSHGQAHVESGFSVNETFLSPNLHEESLVNLRRISDTIDFYGRVLDVPISKKMLTACRLSRSRYRQALEESKKSQEASYSKINKDFVDCLDGWRSKGRTSVASGIYREREKTKSGF